MLSCLYDGLFKSKNLWHGENTGFSFITCMFINLYVWWCFTINEICQYIKYFFRGQGPEITIHEPDVNFGLIRLGQTVSKEITLTNQSQVISVWTISNCPAPICNTEEDPTVCIHSFSYSLINLFIHSIVYPFIVLFFHLIDYFIHSFSLSFIRLFTH